MGRGDKGRRESTKNILLENVIMVTKTLCAIIKINK